MPILHNILHTYNIYCNMFYIGQGNFLNNKKSKKPTNEVFLFAKLKIFQEKVHIIYICIDRSSKAKEIFQKTRVFPEAEYIIGK